MKSWNQPKEIYLAVKQEDCLYVVWICCLFIEWLTSLPDFTPQRCSRRRRRMQGVWLVAVAVVGLHPNVVAMWRSNSFLKAGATHTCTCFFHLAWLQFSILLINILLLVSSMFVSACASGWGLIGSTGNYVAFRRESPFSSSLFIHKSILTSELAVQTHLSSFLTS